MTPQTIPQPVLFPDLFAKPLVATFDQEHASSDGGAVLLKAAERVYGVVKAFARCLADQRAPGEDSAHARGPDRPADLRHRVRSCRWQRCRPLGRRPHPQAAARAGPGVRRGLGVATDDLAVRERREPHRALPDGARVGGVRHRAASASSARRVRRVTIDLDPTDDLTHGAQQLTFFNGHYGGWCYLPLLAFLTFDRETEQYLCAAVLRPGNATAGNRGTVGVLCRLLPVLRAAFPQARFLVRLDGGFATPEVLRLPGCRTATRLRSGNGEERGLGTAGLIRHAGGPRAERGHGRDRARLYRRPLRRPHVGP